MATLFTFHDGPPLNLWEKCSLQSFADFGHELVMFSYRKLDVPCGIRLAPAGDIISDKEFFDFMALAPDQFAQFSDWFRYELLYRLGNWWVDTDVLCLTPSLPDDDIVLGKAGPVGVNGGVIKFPARHPLLADAVDHCRTHWRDVGSSHRSLLGPILINELIGKYPKLKDLAKDTGYFYPLLKKPLWRFGDPAARDEVASVTAACPVIHWWQWRFRAAEVPRDVLPPKGSFLAELFLRHGGQGHPHLDLEIYREKEASGKDRPQPRPPLPDQRPEWRKRLARLFKQILSPRSVM
jgi:hypothetical protein